MRRVVKERLIHILEVQILELKEATVYIDERAAGEWCQLPYYGNHAGDPLYHLYGCPNYGKKKGCPPGTPILTEIMKPRFLVAIKFDLKEWVEHLQRKHPDWSLLECKRPFFWQQYARKRLRDVCSLLQKKFPNLIFSYSPEANGVHVFVTCGRLGIQLEKDPKNFVWEVAIAGEPV